MHNTQTLYDSLHSHLLELNKQIEVVKADLQKTLDNALGKGQEPITIYHMQSRHGAYLLSDLLIAKSNLLAGMANLKAASTKPVKR